MSYYMVSFMVLRIPRVEHERETYTCDSVYQTMDNVVKILENDKNVIDFYQVF